MMKRFLSVMLALSMVLSLCGAVVAEEAGDKVPLPYFLRDNGAPEA